MLVVFFSGNLLFAGGGETRRRGSVENEGLPEESGSEYFTVFLSWIAHVDLFQCGLN